MSPKNSFKFFLHSGFFIFAFSNLGNVFDAIFRTYLVRNLSPSEVGLYFSLFYSFSISLTFSVSIEVFVTKKITQISYNQNFLEESTIWFKRSFLYILLLNVPILLLIFFFRNVILKYYQFDNINILLYFLVFYSLYVVTYPFTIFLKGIRSFIAYSFSVIFFEGAKVAFLFFFIYSGFKLEKAYYSIIFACLIYLMILFFFFYQKKKSISTKINFFWSLKKYLKEYLYVVLFLSFIILSMNIHLVLVRFIFSTEDSGKYSVIVMIRNIVAIIIAPLVSLIFPLLVDLEKNKKKFKIRWLFLLFLINLLLSLMINLFFYFFKEKIFANKYNDLTPLVMSASVNGILLSMIQYICYYYLIKVHSFKKYFVLFSILAVNIVTIIFFSHNLFSVIIINGISFFLIFIVSLFLLMNKGDKKVMVKK